MLKRFLALVWLRCQIILSNKSILLQVLVPFAFTYFYKYLMETQGKVNDQQALVLLMMCLPLSLAVGSPITIILSEEKEKYNLQTLLLSGVKGSEYILSTMFLLFLLTFVIMGTTPLILGVTIVHTFNYITIVLLTSLSIILFYLLIGLTAKSQVVAQIISLPAMILVAFLPMLSGLDKTVAKITDYSFMGLFTKFFTKWEEFSWNKTLIPNLTLLIWIVVLLTLITLTIRKKKIS
ncbi:ABC transporter permease [Streptococcus sp. 2106]|uniref:ABC transporter permease n=1 Tax=Streptococcus sp. 2106 TaxID=2582642 RepID=UPI001562BE52|nr:ABC transporter permease [Streptococcus sp. 2106]